MINIIIFLAAIAQVESGNNPGAIGRSGERSAYQLTDQTWRRYTSDPFEWATTRPEEARRVATENARSLEHLLSAHTRPSLVFWMAHRWNPNAQAEYAQRVERLYFKLEREGAP